MFTVAQLQTITNGSTGFDSQAFPDSTDIACLAAALAGNGVVSGCTVTAKTPAAMTVHVAAGTVMINGKLVSVTATTKTVTAASSSDRKDIVTVNASGTVAVTKGTPCGTAGWTRSSGALAPAKPAIPSTSVLLSSIAVTSSTSAVAAINLTDKRALVLGGNYNAVTLGSNVTVTATTKTVVVSTGTLGVGLWLVNAQAHIKGTYDPNVAVSLTKGTALGTLLGPTSAGTHPWTGSGGTPSNSVALTSLFRCTTAGTLTLYAKTAHAAVVTPHDQLTLGLATGIISVRVA